MDEAERCHEIAYIAYGHLLAQGTVAEIVAQSHLSTYIVSGADLGGLAEKLKADAGRRNGRALSARDCMSPAATPPRSTASPRNSPRRISSGPATSPISKTCSST